MLGILLRRVTVRTLDVAVHRGRSSERRPVRWAAGALDRARSAVGLQRVGRVAPLPDWSGAHPERPMWKSDLRKLEKWQVDQGVRPADGDEPVVEKLAVEVYFRRGCPYSRAAFELLREREVPFIPHDITGDKDRLAWLRTVTRQSTTPQIFIETQSLGGFTELERLDQQGGLARFVPQKPVRRVTLPVVHPEHSPFETGLGEVISAFETSTERFDGDALVAKVKEVLDECRPLVQADGGDIELLDVQGDVVHVQLTGNCIGCPSSQATLRQGIERRLKARLPQLTGIASPQL